MSLLVLGATGTLGRQIVRKALDEGFQVRCFVRNFRKAIFLKDWGAELVYGDLSVPETIPLALLGITAILDASASRSFDLSDATQIDLYSKYILVQASKKAGVKRYIFFSILNAREYPDIMLMKLKASVEDYLIKSGLSYTIFYISGFFQGLVPQYALPVLDNKTIWITDESALIAYIDTQDVAKFAIKSLSMIKTANKSLLMTGVRPWTSNQIIELCEKLSGKRSKVSKISVSFLQILSKLAYFFQWTWSISERLSFVSVLTNGTNLDSSMSEVYELLQEDSTKTETLEKYLQEYFEKIMKKIKEVNYKLLSEQKRLSDDYF
uniref:NmrA-like domain-containing protein n=1 Tax=Melanthalia intermedia TaxID=172989 RepID=A0A345UAP8_9FLOR|nr:hypothetical protein [Melanthalia intermedia]AXI97534.1 hypothetical protein [Melanthalia intermedia]